MYTRNILYHQRILPEGLVNKEPTDIETEVILKEAEELGMKWELIADTDVIQLEYKGKVEHFRKRTPSSSHTPGTRICQNKIASRQMLHRGGLSVVKGFAIYRDDAEDLIKKAWDNLAKPIVVKPSHGTHGDAVFVGVTEWDDCLKKIKDYFAKPMYLEGGSPLGGMLMEEMFVGNEYRVIATREKMLAVMERIPAHVIGDGQHSIQQLIDMKNEDPVRNISQDLYPRLTIDEEMRAILTSQNKALESVPEANEKIQLRRVSNIMAGGEAVDRTDEVHPSVAELAVKAVRSIPGLSWAGLDFMTKDLYTEQTPENYRVIEINAAPEFAMHDLPMTGKKRGLCREFLRLMFPDVPPFE
jgi:cyanophycin synthetase